MRFEGKSIFITGGGTGIGAAIARRFTELGGKVTIMGRRPEPLNRTAQELGCFAIAGDAADGPTVEAAINQAAEAHGGLDVLVANAGTAQIGSVIDTTDAIWEEALRNNLTSAFVASRGAMPSLKRRGGANDAALITGTNLVLDGGNTIVCGQMLRANFAADPRR